MKNLGLTLIVLLILSGCSAQRAPLPPGEIPTQGAVPIEEEQYGQQVFRQLSQRFVLDRDDARINRARRIVDTLTTVRGNNQNIWHVFVFQDDNFHNAGATRGNYIFVWSGLLNAVQDDAELSAVLAHEIGHVLAGHTQPDPVEEANAMLADLAGSATRRIMIQSGGSTVAALSGLGGMIASEILKAFILNPEKQLDELEADQLGLFLMAEAGFDPRKALAFWERAKNDPNFRSMPIEFLSTHPSSETRLEKLEEILPLAVKRYESTLGGSPPAAPATGNTPASKPSKSSAARSQTAPMQPLSSTVWIAAEDEIPVFQQPDPTAKALGKIRRGDKVKVQHRLRRWLFLSDPYEGYVESAKFFPEN